MIRIIRMGLIDGCKIECFWKSLQQHLLRKRNNKWAGLDEDPKSKAAYEKVHGADSWDAFIRDMDKVFDNSGDEIWVYDKALAVTNRYNYLIKEPLETEVF
jgi:hypothetical protein